MKKALIYVFLVFIFFRSFGQTAQSTKCVQTLRLARATYEQGRLNEIEGQLKSCLNGGFSKDEKAFEVEGYKLLCLSYIFLEEPDKANDAMLALLQTDHDFQINPAVDPAEFVGLYRTFRSKPLFSIGLIVGPNATFPTISENYAVSGSATGQGEYTPKVSIQIGLAFERHLSGKFTAAPELTFTNRTFEYTNSFLFVDDSSQTVSTATQISTIKQSWLDLNLLFQYKLGKRLLNSYVSMGPNVGLLLSATNTIENNYITSDVGDSGAPIDFIDNCNKIGFSLIGAAGMKYKFGAVYITANVRYQYGLSKVVNEDKKSNYEAIFGNALAPNIYSQQNASFLVGFVYPIFSPKKIVVKNKKKKSA